MSCPKICPKNVRRNDASRRISKRHMAKQHFLYKYFKPEHFIIKQDFTEDEKQERCVVLNCKSHVSEIPFIPFPNDVGLVKQWSKHIRLYTILVKERLTKRIGLFICCKHFDLQYDVLNYKAWITGVEPAKIDERAFPRYNMTVRKFKACFFPKCYNVSHLNDYMKFFEVPELWEPRVLWFKACGRTEVDMEKRYCCEEHFNINDIICTSASFIVAYGVVPRHKSQIAKEIEEKRIALEQLRIKKLEEEEKIDQNLNNIKEDKMSLDEPDYWMDGQIEEVKTENIKNKLEKLKYLTDDKLKEMFLLSFCSDLKEMSCSQLDFFKHEVIRLINNIKS